MNETIHAAEGIPLDGPFQTGSSRVVHTRRGRPEQYGSTTAVLLLKISKAFVSASA
jgi:hypothetical protein